jgi:hypothetical protein
MNSVIAHRLHLVRECPVLRFTRFLYFPKLSDCVFGYDLLLKGFEKIKQELTQNSDITEFAKF